MRHEDGTRRASLRGIVFTIVVIVAISAGIACNDDKSPDSKQDAGRTDVEMSTYDTGVDARTRPDTQETAEPDSSARDTSGMHDTRFADTGAADTGNVDTSQQDTKTVKTDTSTCGNGIKESGEACDDNNTDSGDYCAADCKSVTGKCGDGKRQSNEKCDDGKISSGCDKKHDGGDGTCVAAGQCSKGYVLEQGKCVSKQIDKHVHIYISNTCKLSVSPQKVTVPRGRTISFVYHNHSNDYAADVWLSYGGGYLGLKKKKKWDDPFIHCSNANRPYTAAADISIKDIPLRDRHCPGHRMKIECQ